MSEVVIFCESYTQINNALYLATQNRHDNPITIVISGNHDLLKFFQAINERLFHGKMDIVYFETYQAGRIKGSQIKRALHVLPDIIKERRYLKGLYNKHFAKMRGAQVFFSSRYWGPYTFYLLKKLLKTNKLVYVPDPSYDVLLPIDKFTPTNIADLAGLAIAKLIFGHDIIMGKLPYVKGFSGMPDKFINEKVERVIDRQEQNEMTKDFDLNRFNIFDVGNYSVIYFDENPIRCGYPISENTFKRELAEIFGILSKYFPENEIARKYHPHSPGDKAMIKTGDVLPDFIPAEFLYNDNVKVYLCIFSGSIANVENGLVVSIADLISLKNAKHKAELKEMLIRRSRSEILFPKSLDEFERILINLKKQGI